MGNFVKDYYWDIDNTFDESGLYPTTSDRICNSLNGVSGFVNFKTPIYPENRTDFFCTFKQQQETPSNIYVDAAVIEGYPYDFSLLIYINEVEIYNQHFDTGDSFSVVSGESQIEKSSIFTPNASELTKLLRNRHSINSEIDQDYVHIRTITSGTTPSQEQKIRYININYSGNSYDNCIDNISDDVYNFYPSSLESNTLSNSAATDYTDASFVAGPTSSAGSDSNWVYGSIEETEFVPVPGLMDSSRGKSINYIDFNFNTSGVLPINSTVNKCIFSVRYDNQSGGDSNIQDWSSIQLFNPTISKNIGWGSGFHIENKGGFTKLESDICFVNNSEPSRQHTSTAAFNNFSVRMHNHPPGTKFSAAQLDLYVSQSNSVGFVIPGHVYFDSDCSTHPSGTGDGYTGKNRLRQQNFDDIFDISFHDLNPGETLSTNASGFDFWENYFTENINGHEYHNHDYKNSVFLDIDQFILESFNSSSNYSLMLHISNSGLSDCESSLACGANILTKLDQNGEKEFELSLLNSNYEFVSFDNTNKPKVSFFDANHHNVFLLIKEDVGSNDSLKFYISDTESEFQQVYSRNGELRNGEGSLYIGGSGVNDYAGYIHEYGISSNVINQEDFYASRYNMTEVLSRGSGLEWIMPPLSGDLNDDFTIAFKKPSEEFPYLFQYNTPMSFSYQTWLSAPSAFIFNLDYENHTDNPSGIIISGYYSDSYNNEEVFVEFEQTLPSGTGFISFAPSSLYDGGSEIGNRIEDRYPNIHFYLYSPNNDNHVNDFKINSFNMCFDGWWTPPTGVDSLLFYIDGYTGLNESLDFYLQNQVVNNGSGIDDDDELDFYIAGHAIDLNNFNFYTQGAIFNNSGLSFYTSGNYSQFDSLELFTKGPLLPRKSGEILVPPPSGEDDYYPFLNFFIEGTTPIENSGNFSMTVNGSNNSGAYNNTEFYLRSNLDPTNSINFFIGTSDEELEDGINFFVDGGIDTSNSLSFYMKNLHSGIDYGIDWHLFSAYNENVSGFNFYTKGQ